MHLFLRHLLHCTVGSDIEECCLLETYVGFLMCEQGWVRCCRDTAVLFLKKHMICPYTLSVHWDMPHLYSVRLLSTLTPLLLEQYKWNFSFSLKKKLPISPFPLIKVLIIQASLLKGKHLFTGSVSTGGICWYYFFMISIAKFAGRIILLSYAKNCKIMSF